MITSAGTIDGAQSPLERSRAVFALITRRIKAVRHPQHPGKLLLENQNAVVFQHPGSPLADVGAQFWLQVGGSTKQQSGIHGGERDGIEMEELKIVSRVEMYLLSVT